MAVDDPVRRAVDDLVGVVIDEVGRQVLELLRGNLCEDCVVIEVRLGGGLVRSASATVSLYLRGKAILARVFPGMVKPQYLYRTATP